MRIRLRPFALAFALAAAAALHAPAQSRLNGVPVPLAGTSNLGGKFSGTLVIQNFSAQGSNAQGVTAIGVVNGVLTDGGTARPVVSDQVALPVDLALTRARRNTELALASAPCELVHLDFGIGVLRVPGSTVTLDRTAVDITTGARSAPASATPSAISTSSSGMLTAGSTATVVAPAGSLVPGTISPPEPPPVATSDLGSLLCAASRLGDSSTDRSQFVQLLNQIAGTM